MNDSKNIIYKAGYYVTRWSQEKKLFVLSMLFLGIIFFVPNNKIFIIVTLSLIAFIYVIFNNLLYAFIYAYILLLPFQNGKSLDFLLIPGEYVYGNFPFYITVNLTASALLSLILLYIHIRNRLSNKFRSLSPRLGLTDFFMGIFVISNIYSAINSNIPLLSFLLTLQIIGYIFVYYFIRYYNLQLLINRMLIPILSSLGIFNGILSGLQMFNIRSPGIINPANSEGVIHFASENASFLRIIGTFSHPNNLGFCMAIFLPILIYNAVSKYSDNFNKIISAFGFLSGLFALILSGSRASWIFFVFSMIMIFRNRNIRKSCIIIPEVSKLMRILVITVAIALPVYVIPRLSQLPVTFGEDGGAAFRNNLIIKSILIAIQNPLGVGLGVFPQILLLDIGGFTSTPTQPHNLLAQIMVSSGFIGLISFIGFIYFILKSAISTWQNNFLHSGIIYYVNFISLVTFFSLSMFYPVFTEQQVIGWLFVLLAIIV